MRGLVAVAAIGAALCGAGVAHAGAVTLADGVMTFQAGPGEANRVFVIRDDGGMHLVDTGAAVTAGGGCTQEAANEAFCTADDLGLLEIDVVAGDEGDYVDLRPAGAFLASKLDGGDGNDTLLGGNAFAGNVLDGGADADTFGGDWGGTVDYSDRAEPRHGDHRRRARERRRGRQGGLRPRPSSRPGVRAGARPTRSVP